MSDAQVPSKESVPGPKQPPRIHGEGCICGDNERYECPVKHRKPPAPASKEMVEVPKELILRCFGFVNGYFQMDPGSAESSELWRALNHEITRPRPAHEPPAAHEPTRPLIENYPQTDAGKAQFDGDLIAWQYEHIERIQRRVEELELLVESARITHINMADQLERASQPPFDGDEIARREQLADRLSWPQPVRADLDEAASIIRSTITKETAR